MTPTVLSASESHAQGATPPSSLSRWLTVRLLLVMAAASVGILLLCFVLLSALFDRFEHEAARAELGRVEAVLLRDSQTLAEIADDYARWDDTYRAAQGEYPAFMDDNFTQASMRNLRFQAVVMLVTLSVTTSTTGWNTTCTVLSSTARRSACDSRE
jgi:hypothetical protein